MANKFVTAIFGDYSKKEVKKLRKTVDKILDLESKYEDMDDKELAAQTPILKERLANGETLDDILPDAFAVCREASWRVLGMKHFERLGQKRIVIEFSEKFSVAVFGFQALGEYGCYLRKFAV